MKNILINILLSIMVVSTLYIGYLLFEPITPLVIKNQPAKILSKNIKAGDIMYYRVDYCRYSNKSARVYRTITGDVNIPTPSIETITKLGCSFANVPIQIPFGTPKGIYHININIEFDINEFRTIVVNFITEDFKVIK
jgi:hypothetical protein